MTIAEYFAGTNMVIALLCIGAVLAVAARAETPFLRVAVVGVLVFEGLRNGLSGYVRLLDPLGFGAQTQAIAFAVLNTLLILGMVLFIMATLRLDRPGASFGETAKTIDRVEEKQDRDIAQQDRIEKKLDGLETKIEGDERRSKDEPNDVPNEAKDDGEG